MTSLNWHTTISQRTFLPQRGLTLCSTQLREPDWRRQSSAHFPPTPRSSRSQSLFRPAPAWLASHLARARAACGGRGGRFVGIPGPFRRDPGARGSSLPAMSALRCIGAFRLVGHEPRVARGRGRCRHGLERAVLPACADFGRRSQWRPGRLREGMSVSGRLFEATVVRRVSPITSGDYRSSHSASHGAHG